MMDGAGPLITTAAMTHGTSSQLGGAPSLETTFSRLAPKVWTLTVKCCMGLVLEQNCYLSDVGNFFMLVEISRCKFCLLVFIYSILMFRVTLYFQKAQTFGE